jgi:hypothetical protein
VEKFSATEALALGLEAPPQALLAEPMTLIRSDEYFCHGNLTQTIPKFGNAARAYVNDLRELRAKLVVQLALPPNQRTVALNAPSEFMLEMLDRAIAAID